jgi:hypothetical protein
MDVRSDFVKINVYVRIYGNRAATFPVQEPPGNPWTLAMRGKRDRVAEKQRL